MAVVTKVEPISDWIEVAVNPMLSSEGRSKAVAAFAKGQLDEAQQTNKRVLGRIPPHETYVDGRKGGAVEAVRADGGSIIFEFELVSDVLLWIADALRDRSPVASGRYRDSHTLFADGQEIPVGGQLPVATEYVFMNPVPYARKIEMGKTASGRAFVIQVPNHIYERTAKDARSRFGNVAKIAFSYRAAAGGAFVQVARVGPLQVKRSADGRFLKGSHTRAGNQAERALRVPAIIVTLN